MRRRCRLLQVITAVVGLTSSLGAQNSSSRMPDDTVTVRFLDADLKAVVQAVGGYLPKPVIAADLPTVRVSLETPTPVTRAMLAVLLQGLVEAQNLSFVEDSAFIRIGPRPVPTQASPQAAELSLGRQPVRLFTVRLKHSRAADVAATLNLLYGMGGEFSGRPGISNGTLSDELRRNNVPPQDATPPRRTEGETPPTRGQAELNGAVTIVPDQLTNSLLIRGSEEDFDVLEQAIEQLDIRPLQILIEVLIVEARQDRNFSLGADLFLPPNSLGGDQTIDGVLTGGGLGDLVIRLMNLGSINLDAIFRTAQSKGDVEIVSRPVLLASNNTEARFLVGSQRPFVQVSRSLPTDAPTRDQVVQYRDVGTKLSVRPTINQDGYVSLIIQQEINSATGEIQFDAPVISTREISTQVLVRDGQTIVLGGLKDRQRDRSQSGIPVLSGIPLVGGIFGSSNRRTTATELYLFLTPRIIRTDADADSLTVPRLPKKDGS